MAKAPHTRVRWYLVAMGIATLGLALGIPIELALFPDWTWTITAGWNWTWLMTWVFCFVFLMVAGDAFFRANTSILVTSTGIFTLADDVEFAVNTKHYKISKELLKRFGLTPEQMESITYGLDGQDREVHIWIKPLGGIRAFGLHLKGGKDGFIILIGRENMIKMGDRQRGAFVVIPRTLIFLHPNQIPPEIQDLLRTMDGYKAGETPIYTCGGIDPGYLDFVRTNPEMHMEILKKGKPSPEGRADWLYLFNRTWELQSHVNRLEHDLAQERERNTSISDSGASAARRTALSYDARTGDHPVVRDSLTKPTAADRLQD